MNTKRVGSNKSADGPWPSDEERSRERENVLNRVVAAIEQTLLENLGNDQFSLKLNSFGKFAVRHKPGTLRKIPFTGEIKMTSDKRKIKFVSLGPLREMENCEASLW
jgi:nucleoid DNA-binding protein